MNLFHFYAQQRFRITTVISAFYSVHWIIVSRPQTCFGCPQESDCGMFLCEPRSVGKLAFTRLRLKWKKTNLIKSIYLVNFGCLRRGVLSKTHHFVKIWSVCRPNGKFFPSHGAFCFGPHESFPDFAILEWKAWTNSRKPKNFYDGLLAVNIHLLDIYNHELLSSKALYCFVLLSSLPVYKFLTWKSFIWCI